MQDTLCNPFTPCVLTETVQLAYAVRIMKNLLRTLCAACLLLTLLISGNRLARAEAAQPEAPETLSFGSDGTFTVLLLADLQSTQFISPHLIRSLNGLFGAVDADLILLLGDQLEGESLVLRLGNDAANVEKTLGTLMAPVVESGIPFAFVFGNHDYDAPVAVSEQLRFFERYPSYFGSLTAADGAARAYGNYVQSIPVYGSSGAGVALNLYLFDCGPTSETGDYGAITREQVAWYNAESARLKAENGGMAVPGAAFSHVPLPEVYDLFEEASADTPGAVEGVGSGAGRYYLLDSAKLFIGAASEAPCPSSVNNGLFNAFLGNDDVFLYVSAHDHVNTFIGAVRGVDMASVPGATFTGYNSRATRGVRLFRFREEAVSDYDTLLVPFSDFDGAEGLGAVSYWLTTTTGVYKAVKVLVVSLLIVAALTLLIIALFRSDSGNGVMEDMPLEEEAFEQPENDWL